jgi:type I restriction enzyme R subunit
MQWRDVRGREAALRFDLLSTRLMAASLAKSSAADDLRGEMVNQISELPVNLKPVQEKLPLVEKAKQAAAGGGLAVADIEEIRSGLRGVMRFRKKTSRPPFAPLVMDVTDDGYRTSPHKVKLAGLDFAAYRSRVESVLRSLFEQSDALAKIRAGKPVSETDIEALVSDVLLQDPDLHLEELLEHYPNKSRSLALAIRRIVGLDAAMVDEHFKAFVQRYPVLNANQIRFLEMLKSHVANYGVIELDKLWEPPFTSIHSEGIDGIFTDSKQIDDLLALLDDLNQTAA